MPTRVCDRTPCDRLRGFFEEIPVRMQIDVVDVTVANKAGAPTKVSMDYCPFCGTRFGEDVTAQPVLIKG